MWRRLTMVGIAVALTVSGVFSATTVQAVSSRGGQLKPDDSSVYNLVSMDCLAVKFKLSEVHQQDGLLRVTLGQRYENISTKFMARLNGRIVENRMDGGELVKLAANFETALGEFRNDYRAYEVSMNDLLKADCQSQKQTYYMALQDTKELRAVVQNDVAILNRTIDTYYKEFSLLRERIELPTTAKGSANGKQ